MIESENEKKLFRIAKTLLGNVKKSILPDLGSDENLANSFNDYFINKVVVIRDDITKSTPVSAATATKQKLFPLSNNNNTNFVPILRKRLRS